MDDLELGLSESHYLLLYYLRSDLRWKYNICDLISESDCLSNMDPWLLYEYFCQTIDC